MDNIYNYPYFNIESALERVTTQAAQLTALYERRRDGGFCLI